VTNAQIESEDWRLSGPTKDFLRQACLRWQKYASSDATNDHDHCEFCWTKFMVGGASDSLEEGYATADGHYWICKQCFADFSGRFQWRVENK
jgi:hypothetical protein